MHRAMKRLIGALAGAAVLFVLLMDSANAITITDATLSSGTVTVSGNKAAKAAPIKWEGTQVATSTNGGAFTFTTAVVPTDCTGAVFDGVNTVDVAIAGCTVPPPPPTTAFPATGQTTCYDSSNVATDCANTSGQDGNIMAGAALSYTSNLDGTITDNNTGLVWEKKTTTCGGEIHCVNDTYTWAGAFTNFIDVLNDVPNGVSCFAGQCDWRLPNVKELQSIVNYGNVSPAVSPAFNDDAGSGCSASCTAVDSYWASSSRASSPGFAWFVDFYEGFVAGDFRWNSNSVRAVRGGL